MQKYTRYLTLPSCKTPRRMGAGRRALFVVRGSGGLGVCCKPFSGPAHWESTEQPQCWELRGVDCHLL